MCIIIYQPRTQEKILTHTIFTNAHENNPDGHGLMYVRDNTLVVRKQMGNIDQFYEKYLEATKHDTPIVVHFRIGTSGGNNLPNCHPFYLNPKLAFVHNGVVGRGHEHLSDTRVYAREVLQKLPKNWYKDMTIAKLVATDINSDKMIFMDNTGYVLLLNESQGHWKDGIWFSNHSYNYSSKRKRSTDNYPFGCSQTSDKSYTSKNTNLAKIEEPSDSFPILWNEKIWCWTCLPTFAWQTEDIKEIASSLPYYCDRCGVKMTNA